MEVKDNVFNIELTEEENRILVEHAVNCILREYIDKLEEKDEKVDSIGS